MKKSSRYLTPHFQEHELACPCCGACEMKPEFLAQLEKLREVLGHPISISSGYRCEPHNAQVGGKTNSKHLTGEAADIVCPDSWSAYWLIKAALHLDVHFGGIGVGEGFVHVDSRDNVRLWTY